MKGLQSFSVEGWWLERGWVRQDLVREGGGVWAKWAPLEDGLPTLRREAENL